MLFDGVQYGASGHRALPTLRAEVTHFTFGFAVKFPSVGIQYVWTDVDVFETTCLLLNRASGDLFFSLYLKFRGFKVCFCCIHIDERMVNRQSDR